jgi:hypothetical protein
MITTETPFGSAQSKFRHGEGLVILIGSPGDLKATDDQMTRSSDEPICLFDL